MLLAKPLSSERYKASTVDTASANLPLDAELSEVRAALDSLGRGSATG